MDATDDESDLEYPASDTPMGLDDEVLGSDVANRTRGKNGEEPYKWTEESLAKFKKYGMVPPLTMQHECEEESEVDEDLKEAAAAAAKKLTIRLPGQNQQRDANAKLDPKAHHPGLADPNTDPSVKANEAEKSEEESDDVMEVLKSPNQDRAGYHEGL